MPDFWNEPIPLMDQAMCTRIKVKTDEYLTLVKWRNNGQPRDLKHAVELAKRGCDGGKDITMSLRPTSKVFADWMDWNNLVTFLFNRDTDYQNVLLSALRNTIKSCLKDKVHVVLIIIYYNLL